MGLFSLSEEPKVRKSLTLNRVLALKAFDFFHLLRTNFLSDTIAVSRNSLEICEPVFAATLMAIARNLEMAFLMGLLLLFNCQAIKSK